MILAPTEYRQICKIIKSEQAKFPEWRGDSSSLEEMTRLVKQSRSVVLLSCRPGVGYDLKVKKKHFSKVMIELQPETSQTCAKIILKRKPKNV